MRSLLLAVPLLVFGCARERELAPADLDRLLKAAWAGYDQSVERTEYAAGLDDWLAREGDSEAAWDGLKVDNLTRAEVGGLVGDDVVLAEHRGVATAFQSAFDAEEHAALAVLADQRWTDAATFERYDREVLGGDPGAFARGADSLLTRNIIEKSGPFGIRIPYTLRKDYHWAPVEGGKALLAMWWLEEQGCSDNGKNCVLQSFGLDILTPRSQGAQRLLVNWIQTRTEADAFLSEDGMIGLIASGNQDLLLATDEELSK